MWTLAGCSRGGERSAGNPAGPSSLTNEQREQGSALIRAAKAQDPGQIESLLDKGAPIDWQDDTGRTALTYAVLADDIDCIRVLVSKGADATLTDHEGHSAIDLESDSYIQSAVEGRPDDGGLANAVSHGDSVVARNHLQHGDHLDGAIPPIVEATQDGHLGMVETLLSAGESPDAIDPRSEFSWVVMDPPLPETSARRSRAVGGDYPRHAPALVLAAYWNEPEIIRQLLRARANREARDDLGRTALFYAQDPGCFTPLISARANVDARDRDGETPLFEAKSAAFAEALLRAGANPNALDKDGRPLIVHAVYNNGIDVMKLLLKFGAKVNATDSQGDSALDQLSQGTHDPGSDEMEALLKSYGGKHVWRQDG